MLGLECTIYNRSAPRAEALCARLGGRYAGPLEHLTPRSYRGVVNATPMGAAVPLPESSQARRLVRGGDPRFGLREGRDRAGAHRGRDGCAVRRGARLSGPPGRGPVPSVDASPSGSRALRGGSAPMSAANDSPRKGVTRPDRDGFRREASETRVVPVVRTLSADGWTPVSAFHRLAGTEPDVFLFESVERGEKIGRHSLLGRRPFLRAVAHGQPGRGHRSGRGEASRRWAGRADGPARHLRRVPPPARPGSSAVRRGGGRLFRIRHGAVDGTRPRSLAAGAPRARPHALLSGRGGRFRPCAPRTPPHRQRAAVYRRRSGPRLRPRGRTTRCARSGVGRARDDPRTRRGKRREVRGVGERAPHPT